MRFRAGPKLQSIMERGQALNSEREELLESPSAAASSRLEEIEDLLEENQYQVSQLVAKAVNEGRDETE